MYPTPIISKKQNNLATINLTIREERLLPKNQNSAWRRWYLHGSGTWGHGRNERLHAAGWTSPSNFPTHPSNSKLLKIHCVRKRILKPFRTSYWLTRLPTTTQHFQYIRFAFTHQVGSKHDLSPCLHVYYWIHITLPNSRNISKRTSYTSNKNLISRKLARVPRMIITVISELEFQVWPDLVIHDYLRIGVEESQHNLNIPNPSPYGVQTLEYTNKVHQRTTLQPENN